MPAAKQNLVIEQGATFDPVFTLSDSAGDLIDLTGAEARMQMRKDVGDTEKIVELRSGFAAATTESPDGTITLGGTAGTITVLVTDEVTETILHTEWTDADGDGSSYTGVWDLEVEFADGVTRRLLEGTVKFRREVTRA